MVSRCVYIWQKLDLLLSSAWCQTWSEVDVAQLRPVCTDQLAHCWVMIFLRKSWPGVVWVVWVEHNSMK